MSEERTDFKFWIGFFIGGLIGAVVIFFLGTKEGKKTGKLLEKKGREVIDDLEERVEDFEEKGKELVKKGEALKDDVIDEIEHKKHVVTKEVNKRFGQALEKLEDVQKTGLSETGKLKKHFINLPKRK